jgi:hypothetical protein
LEIINPAYQGGLISSIIIDFIIFRYGFDLSVAIVSKRGQLFRSLPASKKVMAGKRKLPSLFQW